MRFIAFLKACLAAYRIAGKSGVGYMAVLNQGVPDIIIMVGTGREAWRISTVATEAYALKDMRPVAHSEREP